MFDFNGTSTFDRYGHDGGCKRRLDMQDRDSSQRGDGDAEDDGELHGGTLERLCVGDHPCHARGRHTGYLGRTDVRGDFPGYVG